MDTQLSIEDKGGTQRLGLYPCHLVEGSLAKSLYREDLIFERHRHRYEVNNAYREPLERGGLRFGGLSPNDKLVEMIELPQHPYFIASQFHPEFRSRPDRPHPLFRGLVAAALAQ